jgi:hypothetical protein
VLTAIAAAMPIGTVTNCSDELGRQAAELVGVPFVALPDPGDGLRGRRSPGRLLDSGYPVAGSHA